MESNFRNSLWNQFGASLDMLENAVQLCPDTLWDTPTLFWYQVYHCLFWTDYYLTRARDFHPPCPIHTI